MSEAFDMAEVVKAFNHRLDAARYAFHCVVRKRYHDATERGEMNEEQAKGMYAIAMANYDQIVRDSGNGAWSMANIEDMAKGMG